MSAPAGPLPHLNAALNLTAACFLWLGWRAIRAGQREAHRRRMLAAFAVSVVFLISYLTHHALHGSRKYAGPGWSRPIYFSILISHTTLAAGVPVLALLTLRLARRGEFDRHRRLARWTWPIWMYVSLTGVVVYLMLYQLPQAPPGG